MQKNKWSIKFDWVKSVTSSGITYTQQDRLEKYNKDRFIAVDSIYFKFNKYLDGVCFSYINNLKDIYKRDLLTGDGYSIYCMYNEYDVVDRVFKNMILVDVASNYNIDLNQQYVQIDGVTLLPGHLVLLYNQTSEFENDVYLVNDLNFLENAEFLSSREKSDKFSCSVKLGTNADKHIYLLNNGFEFPTIYEPKRWIEGKPLILKNKIKYNLFNLETNSASTSKMIFTDYEFARKQFQDTYTLFESFIVSSTPSTSFTLKYHHDEYSIRINGSSIYQETGLLVSDISGTTNGTIIPFSTFNSEDGDQILLKIYSGSTLSMSMTTFITGKTSSYFILEEIIPNYILRDLKNCTYDLLNLNLVSDWTNLINLGYLEYTPYSPFFDYYADTGSTGISIYPKQFKYDKYFDYSDLVFSLDGSDYNFSVTSQYLNYTLYDRLNEINPSIFISTFTGITNNYTLTDITGCVYTDHHRIRITSNTSGLTDIFTEYTYVDVSTGSVTGRTLIYEVNDYDLIIEKPSSFSYYSTPTIISISNIDGLENISNILYEVYMNENYDWYIEKSSNERKYICKAYAELLTHIEAFRINVTGILYENDNNEFILKLYDIENDNSLTFQTVELMFLGADKETRIPIPYKKETDKDSSLGLTDNLPTEYLETWDWNVLDGGWYLSGTTSPYTYEVFDFGFNSVLGGPNNPPFTFTIVDGGINFV